METLKIKSKISQDGKIQLQLPETLANQEVELILIYQTINSHDQIATIETEIIDNDPLIGLFSGSPDLATRSEEILEKEINSTAGWTWKNQ